MSSGGDFGRSRAAFAALAELFAPFVDLCLELVGTLVVLRRDRLVAFALGVANLVLEGFRVLGLRPRAEAYPCARLVDEVDRLVGQEAVADVPV